jgi:phosphate/sulfate permease
MYHTNSDQEELPDFDQHTLKYYYQQVMLTSEMYRVLMIKSAMLVCMSHGSNDVANAISPLSVLIKHNGYSY